jgi:acyl-CoA synthetase (AMP-forming)/AMP-acid ligase II
LYVPRLQLSGKRDWEAELRTNLANYKIPKQILQVAALPLNEGGKVDRHSIQRLIE